MLMLRQFALLEKLRDEHPNIFPILHAVETPIKNESHVLLNNIRIIDRILREQDHPYIDRTCSPQFVKSMDLTN